MARRRYISTQISLDAAVDKLAQEYGDFAALLYSWMIPHTEDNATITGDPDELMFTVIPRRRDKTIEDIITVLEGMEEVGLINWDRENKIIYFPPENFYRYQSYIREEKRRKEPVSKQQRQTPPNSDNQRRTAQNTVSPSPSLKDLNNPPNPPQGEGVGQNNCASSESLKVEMAGGSGSKKPVAHSTTLTAKQQVLFERFWAAYPKRRNRGQAEKAFKKVAPDEQLMAAILTTIERAKKSAQWLKDDGQYIPYPATWLNAKGWEDEINDLKTKHIPELPML